MPIAATSRDRVHQVARWIRSEAAFKTPFPVLVRVVGRRELRSDPDDPEGMGDTHYCGDCTTIGKKTIIRVGNWLSWGEQIDTLLHEWAHAATIRHYDIETQRIRHGGHDDEWALMYGRIYRAFNDQLGWLRSRDF